MAMFESLRVFLAACVSVCCLVAFGEKVKGWKVFGPAGKILWLRAIFFFNLLLFLNISFVFPINAAAVSLESVTVAVVFVCVCAPAEETSESQA